MCFERLYEAQQKNELLLIDGGMCHWHLCRNGQLTIREILSTKPGAGSAMLAELKCISADYIFAKCPVDLLANSWYKKRGFEFVGTETTQSGRGLNRWRLNLS